MSAKVQGPLIRKAKVQTRFSQGFSAHNLKTVSISRNPTAGMAGVLE
jgi:hypothetical protein